MNMTKIMMSQIQNPFLKVSSVAFTGKMCYVGSKLESFIEPEKFLHVLER